MFGERENRPMSKKANPAALLPILVFLVLYLGLGLIFEYVLKIPMGFYSIPIVVIFLIALLVACCQNRALSFDEKLTLMGRGVGDKNIITMLLIFLAAGNVRRRRGPLKRGELSRNFMLSIIPSEIRRGGAVRRKAALSPPRWARASAPSRSCSSPSRWRQSSFTTNSTATANFRRDDREHEVRDALRA